MITDIIGQEIKVDDYVVFYNNVYQVKSLGKFRANGAGNVKIMICNGGETSKPVTKFSKDMVVLNKNAVLLWKLRE